MSYQFDDETGFETLAIRAGLDRTNEGEHSEAIFPTSSYVFKSAAEAAARFSGTESGNIYSRFTNPTVRTFENRLAALEGAEKCLATSSGMAAITATFLGILKAGDHIISSSSIFGVTNVLMEKFLKKFDIEVSYVDLVDNRSWENAIQSNTRILFLETPSNPLGDIADIRALADLAHANNALLVVDNALCTPALQQPIKFGADIVVHSATKFIDGQGRCMGGAVLGSEAVVGTDVFSFLRTAGPSMSPFNAWVFSKSLETLKLRMDAHTVNALKLAKWLELQPSVVKVYYCGLETHPQYELACKQQSGFGGIVSFEMKDQETAWKVIDSTQMLSITGNLGDTRTTITHPATTTHGRLTPELQVAAGIKQGLIRLSVGLEDLEDIKADLQRGFSSL
ncbi:MAG: O-succinylhomoserine sulfhydrylase [Gammaproteobacteria bacterium]|nr:O-succinylhomoserine sulfhydrylase [Gammaproteobacteria bacterium]